MQVTASELRRNIYRLLDQVLESGMPLEIERKGRRLQVVEVGGSGRLSRVIGDPDLIVGDPADLADLDMSEWWDPEGGLADDAEPGSA